MDRRAGLGALAALALLWMVSLGAAGDPAQSLALSPPTVDLTSPPLVPGATRVARLTVFNGGDQEMDVTTHGAEPAGDWLTAEPASFHLALHGKQEVTVRLAVPAGTPTGHYLGRIDFKPVVAAANGSLVVSGVSGLLDITVDPTVVHGLAIDAMRVANIHRGEPLPVQVEVRNQGNVPDAYHLELAVLDAARTTVLKRLSFDSAPLDAGDSRTDAFSAPLELAQGQYAYNLTATLAGAATPLRQETGLFLIAAPGANFTLGAMPFLSVSPSEARTGQEVRLTVLFRNEGVVGIEAARFVGSVLRDGVEVGPIETPAAKVGPHGSEALLAGYVPDAAGAYAIRGHVVYDGLRTEDGEATFTASDPPGGFLSFLPRIPLPNIPPWVATPLGLALLLVGLLGLLGLLGWVRRRDKPKPAPPGPGKPSPSRWLPAWLRARLGATAVPVQPANGSSRSWHSLRFDAAAPVPPRPLGPSPPPPAATPPPQPKRRGKLSWLAGAAALLRRVAGRILHRKVPSGRLKSDLE